MDLTSRDNLSRHARTRCAQRGATASAVEAVNLFADIDIPARVGCRVRQASHAAIMAMLDEGVSASDADAARTIALVVDPDGRVVTVLRVSPSDRRVRKPRVHRRGQWIRS